MTRCSVSHALRKCRSKQQPDTAKHTLERPGPEHRQLLMPGGQGAAGVSPAAGGDAGGTATVEDSLVVSYKIKHTFAL